MAPRRGGSSGGGSSSGDSNVCPGCDTPVNVYIGGFRSPYNASAVAFSIICAIAFLVLWILSLMTKKVGRPNNKKPTRYGLTWALLTILCYQIIDAALLIVQNIRGLYPPAGFYIVYPFRSAFYLASDVFIVWTTFGVIRSRFQALRGEIGIVKTLRVLAIVAASILAVLAVIWDGFYIRNIVYHINSSRFRYGYSYNDDELDLIRHGVDVARLVVALVLSLAFIGLAVKLFMDYRSKAIKSKIPIFLLALVTPWYFIRSVADLAVNLSYKYDMTTNLRALSIIVEITYSLFSVPIFIGLVLCAWRPEFSSIVSPAGPMHLGGQDYQNSQSQGPVYFNNQPMQQAMPHGTPYVTNHQSWTSSNGLQQYSSPPPQQNGFVPPPNQQQQYPKMDSSNAGFYAPQPYPQQQYIPHPQPGSPPPQQQQFQQHAGGVAELGQYRTLSPQSPQSGGNVSPVDSSPGQAHAVPGQGPTLPHDNNPGVIR